MFLKSLKGHSERWFVKIFLFILASSFVLWGIAGAIQDYFASRPIAKIGNIGVSHEEFSRYVHMVMANTKNPEQLKKTNVHKDVLNQILDQKALKLYFENQNYTVSDTVLHDIIHQMPAFQKDGVFDADLFVSILGKSNISKHQFFDSLRQDIYAQQINVALSAFTSLPPQYVQKIMNGLTQKNTFTFVTLPIASVSLFAESTVYEHKIFYEQYKNDYTIPEMRQLKVAVFDQHVLMKKIDVTENEVNKHYETSLNEYSQPEQRMVQKVIYRQRDAAFKAYEALQKGRPMTAVVRDVPGGKYQDVGLVDRESLHESSKNIVFNTEIGHITAPLQEDIYFVIYEVTQIEKAKTEPLSAVREKIENDIRTQKYGDYFNDVRNTIEDALAAGKTLEDLAKDYPININAIAMTDRLESSGDNQDALMTLPNSIKKAVIDEAFTLHEGQTSRVVDPTAEYAFVLHVEKVMQTRLPSFDEIQVKVKSDYELSKKREKAYKIASELASDVKDTADLAQKAHAQGLSIRSDIEASRLDLESKQFFLTPSGTVLKNFTGDLVRKLLRLPLHKATFGETKDGMVIAMLSKVTPNATDEKTKDALNKAIKSLAERDVSLTLINQARRLYPADINKELFTRMSRALGGVEDTQN
jgi:peptidyl-prolyl cis-trans isomerase D